jgi:hypothetical protein
MEACRLRAAGQPPPGVPNPGRGYQPNSGQGGGQGGNQGRTRPDSSCDVCRLSSPSYLIQSRTRPDNCCDVCRFLLFK